MEIKGSSFNAPFCVLICISCLFRIKTVQISLWLYFIFSFITIGFDEIFPVFADSSKAYGKNFTMFKFRVVFRIYVLDGKLLSNSRFFPLACSIGQIPSDVEA